MKLKLDLKALTLPCDRGGGKVNLNQNFCRWYLHCVSRQQFVKKYKKQPPKHPK